MSSSSSDDSDTLARKRRAMAIALQNQRRKLMKTHTESSSSPHPCVSESDDARFFDRTSEFQVSKSRAHQDAEALLKRTPDKHPLALSVLASVPLPSSKKLSISPLLDISTTKYSSPRESVILIESDEDESDILESEIQVEATDVPDFVRQLQESMQNQVQKPATTKSVSKSSKVSNILHRSDPLTSVQLNFTACHRKCLPFNTQTIHYLASATFQDAFNAIHETASNAVVFKYMGVSISPHTTPQAFRIYPGSRMTIHVCQPTCQDQVKKRDNVQLEISSDEKDAVETKVPPTVVTEPQTILVRIGDAKKRISEFHVSPNATILSLKKAFFSRMTDPPAGWTDVMIEKCIVFRFDGEVLANTAKFESLDIEDGDMIEAVIKM